MSSLAKHLLRGIYNIKESILISVVTVHIGQSHGSTDHGATIHYQVEGLSIRELQAASVVCVWGRSVGEECDVNRNTHNYVDLLPPFNKLSSAVSTHTQYTLSRLLREHVFGTHMCRYCCAMHNS